VLSCVTMPTAKQRPLPHNRVLAGLADSLDALTLRPIITLSCSKTSTSVSLRTRILPGQLVPVHTHRLASCLLRIELDDFVRRDPQGNVLARYADDLRSTNLNIPIWLEPLPPHSVENVAR